VIVQYTKASVAEFLGWTRKANKGRTVQPNHACEFAFKALDLVELKELKLADLKRLTRREGEALVDSTWSHYRWKQEKQKWQREEEQREQERAWRNRPEYQRACRQIARALNKTVPNGATEAEATSARAMAEKLMNDHGISAAEAIANERANERFDRFWARSRRTPEQREEEERQKKEERKKERHAAKLRDAVWGLLHERPLENYLKVIKKRRDELDPATIDRMCQALEKRAQSYLEMRDFLRSPAEPTPGPGTPDRAPEACA
jgi:hypothetical protein